MDKEILTLGSNDDRNHRIPPTYMYNTGSEQSTGSLDQEQGGINRNQATEDQLGPLPPNWEKAFTDTGEVYFIEYVYINYWLIKLKNIEIYEKYIYF